jgi:hypothetical protein
MGNVVPKSSTGFVLESPACVSVISGGTHGVMVMARPPKLEQDSIEGQFQVLTSLPAATHRLYITAPFNLSQLGPQQQATRWQLQLSPH